MEHSGLTSTKLAGLPGHVSDPDPSIYWSDNYVVLDFETTTGLKGSPLDESNSLVLACWQHTSGGVRNTFGSQYEQAELVSAIESADFIVAHNAKFEMGWLRRCGVDLRSVICFDTLLAEYVLGGNRFGLHQLGLNECLTRHGLPGKLDLVGLMIKGGVPVEEIPQSWLLRYCERDVEATGELFLLQRELLKKGGLEAINYQRCLVTPCLADIEFNGMYLDAEKVEQEVQKQEKEYEALTNRLMDFCEGASPSSTKQMREFIFDTLRFRVPTDHKGKPMVTPAGDPSVAAPVLEKLVATTQRQRTFLALRQEWARCHSDLTKYLRKLKDCVEEDGGLLRASINQGTTRTHRFSSNGLQHRIQFQNLNRNFKPLFRSRHSDWLMGEADGAQLEFRTAVHLGRDRVGLHDIVSGHDIHRHTASILNGVSAEDVTKAQRQDAKSDSFKPLYGGTSGTPAQQLYYEAFKERYQGIAETQQAWTQEVLKSKHLTTEWGMRYYWPDTKLTRSGWITNTTSIYNYPVQAFATAEVIPIALVCGWHRMAKLKSFLVNTVHDSLIAEVHPDEQEAWHDVGRRCLIDDTYSIISKLYGVDITVPLGSGVVLGDHWSVGKEVPYEADENLYKQAATKEGMI